MVRGKTQMKRIENNTSRQVRLSKRRNGLLKKAFELSVLYNAEVALISVFPRGKLYEFSSSTRRGSLFFPKPSLKKISKIFRTESRRRLKACNCPTDLERKNSKDICFRCQQPSIGEDDISSEEEDDGTNGFEMVDISTAAVGNQMKYGLVAIKQMVGIFVTVWIRRELIQHVSHLRISCTSRGIMGCLGNKGCISVSMLFHQKSFCFICSHLAYGEKEGDELRRNSDVVEILKNTQFAKICSRSETNWN
ncbi:hypothetical protein EUGRSUZ_E02489 [Eucalyptus grandis]|uniref:Uncharacterized protein n=2 Tax=Eucalyptus grandis TaxID=71139 RepID=A0ACC3KX65_EUCGR|nr:hypothetical protein EUGRSUZ_E02489 [Eucalyptus grandis]